MIKSINPIIFNNFIGFDVGKDNIVAYDLQTGEITELQNNKTALQYFVKTIDRRSSYAVCEATGGYESLLLSTLLEAGITTHRADAAKVKAYIRSFGIYGKTDKIDAIALAKYASDRHHDLRQWSLPQEEKHALKTLINRRVELVEMRTAEKNRNQSPAIKMQNNKILKRSVKNILLILDKEITAMDDEIANLIKENQNLKAAVKIITDIDGIGNVVATTLLAHLPELGKLTRRKIASLSGCAPHPKDSGKMHGYRRMRGGRDQVKQVLFIAALSASRNHKKPLGAFYKHLIEQGKKPMIAIGALMRKIIVIANAKLRDYYHLQLS